MPILALVLITSFLGCDLYNLDDSGSGGGTRCPSKITLTAADLPCTCFREQVTELPEEDCVCDPSVGLSCDGIDTGPLLRVSVP